MAGRGFKFKKYYEDQKETMSITESIETTLRTGHRLANLAVAPILPFRLRELEQNAGRVDLSLGQIGETHALSTIWWQFCRRVITSCLASRGCIVSRACCAWFRGSFLPRA